MKGKFSFVFVVMALLGPKAAAEYTELPAMLDGSMSLYDFEAVQPSALPDSLVPVYIDYVARHGARYLTSESKVKSCEKFIEGARRRGSLTRRGEDFARLLQEVRDNTGDEWGMLSPVGKAQELRLGREMARMYPTVFTAAGSSVEGVASYVPRVVETMDNFTVAIADVYEGIDTRSESGHRYDRLTRFFVTDTVYDNWRHNGDWRAVYDDFVARHISTAPAIRLLGRDNGLTDAEMRQFAYDMYKVLQGMRAASLPAPDTRWMSEEEYRACWEATNLEKYFQYSISSLSTIPACGAQYLLYHLLGNAADLEAGVRRTGLHGVFGHAETLLPFFALLGIEDTVALPLDYDRLAEEWNDARLTPLAANLAVIYARSPSGRIYAAMRLNGRNISPTRDPGRPVVPLADLQRYWLERLRQF